MVNIFSVGEVVQLGIQIEKNGRDFYSTVAMSSKEDKAKQIFQYLADEEKKHIRLFENILSDIEEYESSGLYTEEYFAYLRALSEEYVFTKEKKGQEIAQKVKDDREAIEIGIDAEKDSILFYNEMKKLVIKDRHGALNKLIEQEQEHLRKLSELKGKF